MRTKTLEQNTAQDFAGLYVDQFQKLRSGNMTMEQVKWFTNLPFEEREKLMGKKEYSSANLDPMTLDPTMLKFEVEVDTTLTNRQAVEATDRVLYVNDGVLSEAPRGTKVKQTIYLFKKGSKISCLRREEEFNKRNLEEADLLTISAFNKAHPEFADNRPNSIQWKNSKGEYCYAAFRRFWSDWRYVDVFQYDRGWDARWWFVGVSK